MCVMMLLCGALFQYLTLRRTVFGLQQLDLGSYVGSACGDSVGHWLLTQLYHYNIITQL